MCRRIIVMTVELPLCIFICNFPTMSACVSVLNGKLQYRYVELCAGIVFSHFISKEGNQSCSVVLEDGWIITQDGELLAALHCLLKSVKIWFHVNILLLTAAVIFV